MKDDDPTRFARQPRGFAQYVQWVAAAFVALIGLIFVTSDFHKLDLPGAPVSLYVLACVMLAVTVTALSPPVFFRLPGKGKLAAYLAILATIIAMTIYSGILQPIYERTPQGAKEAAADAAREAAAAIRDAKDIAEQGEKDKAAKAVADAEAAQKQTADNAAKLKACFSYSTHEIPKLTSQVQDALENPKSFEYVKTEEIDSGDLGWNVEMVFRAENGFSAIRTLAVRAKINPGDCSVIALDKFED